VESPYQTQTTRGNKMMVNDGLWHIESLCNFPGNFHEIRTLNFDRTLNQRLSTTVGQ
ncbi:uncharacterized protein METZ01_LOCUS136635, partial [marine metagenome]